MANIIIYTFSSAVLLLLLLYIYYYTVLLGKNGTKQNNESWMEHGLE